jgi:hypothetical protein
VEFPQFPPLMTLKTKYNLKDAITINEIKTKGLILGIYIGDTGLSYNIRYFKDNSPTTCYFYEEEISQYNSEDKDIGFAPKKV